jgi:hypothetical protein
VDYDGGEGAGTGATVSSRFIFSGGDLNYHISGPQAYLACPESLSSGTSNYCIYDTSGNPSLIGGQVTIGSSGGLNLLSQAGSTGCAQIAITTGAVTNTGTPCGSGGSGTVTTTGSPASGNMTKFSGSTSITNAAAADVVNLFSTCSGTQYLGADGACHNASGAGTVTSVTFTGDGVVDSSTPSTAVTSSGTVTATVLTQAAHTILGNHTGSTAAPTFATLTAADIPAGCQAITSSSGAATVNWASGPCAVVTANTGDTAVAVTFTNPVAGYPGGYFLGLVNNATPNTWSFSPTPNQLKTPIYASEAAYNYYTYTGSAYNGTGSNATPTLIYGTERSTPPTSVATAFVCHWNSTTHQMTCSDNGTNTGNMVTPLSSQAAHEWVRYIDNTGLQNSTQPACGDISNAGTACQAATGTSGATVPLLNAANTFSALDGFSAGINLSGSTSPLQLAGSAGTSGQCPISGGAGVTPAWGSCGSGGSGGAALNPSCTFASLATGCTINVASLSVATANVTSLIVQCATLTAGTYTNLVGTYTVTSSGGNLATVVTSFGSATAAGSCTANATSGNIIGDGVLYPASAASTLVLNTQTANTGLYGPASGSAAAPTFRAQVAADLPVGTVITSTPVMGSSDTITCGTGTTLQTFATTISRPAFTQTAGAIWELKIKAIETSTASALTFQFGVLDNGTNVYLSGNQTNSLSTANLPVSATVDEEISGSNLASAALTVTNEGSVFSNTGLQALNHTAQTTGYASNNARTISVTMQCSAATAGNTVTLLGLTETKIY